MDLSLGAYLAMIEFLGLPKKRIPAPSAAMEIVPDPEVIATLGVDILSIKPGDLKFLSGVEDLPKEIVDGWGVRRALKQHRTGAYYEIASHPLSGTGIGKLGEYPWPTVDPSAPDETLRAHAEKLHTETDCALVGRFGGPLLEIASSLLGQEEWYIRLLEDPDFVFALLNRISDICTAQDLRGINACGEYLQIMKVSGEDLGMQSGLLYPPDVFHNIILPPLRSRWQRVRERLSEVNPSAKIMLHSCGAISPIIPELMESGIDIIDPVQPRAFGMDPDTLRASFSNIVFHGGIDIQQLLPFGTVDEIQRRTTEVLDGFRANEGGFIVAPSHCVQPDIPPENLIAMIDTVREYSCE